MVSETTQPIRVSAQVHNKIASIADEANLTQQEVATKLIIAQDKEELKNKIETVDGKTIENTISELQKNLQRDEDDRTTKITIHAEHQPQQEQRVGEVGTLLTYSDAVANVYCPVCGNSIINYGFSSGRPRHGQSMFNQLRISCPHCRINRSHKHSDRDVYSLVTIESETETETETNTKVWDRIESADPVKAVWDAIAYDWGIYALRYADKPTKINDFIRTTEPLTGDDDIPITRLPDPQLWFDAFTNSTRRPQTKRYQLHRYNMFVKHYLSYLATNRKIPPVSMQIADWSAYAKPEGELSDKDPFILFTQDTIPNEVKTILKRYEQSWSKNKLLTNEAHNLVAVISS